MLRQDTILFSKLTSLVALVDLHHDRVHYRRGYRPSFDEGWILLSLRWRFWQQARRKFDR